MADNLNASNTNYTLRNPDYYTGTLNVTNSYIYANSSQYAIKADSPKVDLTVNFVSDSYLNFNNNGNNYVSGNVQATTLNFYNLSNNYYGPLSGLTIINGNVDANSVLWDNSTVVFGSMTREITGNISYGVSEGNSINTSIVFTGNTAVNGNIDLGSGLNSVVYIGGNVTFNGLAAADDFVFTSAGSLTLSSLIAGFGFGGPQFDSLTGNINFQGNNAKLYFGDYSSVNGNIDTNSNASGSGTIYFNGNARISGNVGVSGILKEINLDNSVGFFGGRAAATIFGYTNVRTVNLNAAGIIAFGEGLDTRDQDGAYGSLNYDNHDATVLVGTTNNGSTPSVSWSLYANVTTSINNNGTLQFLSGAGDVYGSVGSSTTKALKQINIGSTGADTAGTDFYSNSADATFHTNVYAQTVSLLNGNNNHSVLQMASGYSLKGNELNTDRDGYGVLWLEGGTQSADFASLGTSSNSLYCINSGNNEGDVSTITGDVFAKFVTTLYGTTNFQNDVTVTSAFIQGGTTNFNIGVGTNPSTYATNGGTTISNRLTFNGNGTANFYQGVTLLSGTNPGAINFNGYGATVNISAGKDLNGNVLNIDSISAEADGTLNFLGGTSALNGYVGTGIGNQSIGLLHAGVDSQSNLTVSGNIYSIETRLSRNSTLTARGDITGNVTNSSTVAAGTLNLTENYDQTVNGNIGSSTAPLSVVNAGAAGSGAGTYFNGMVYANTLNFTGNGYIELNGTNEGSAVGGIVGKVDFHGYEAELGIADNVNLTFGTAAATFANANNATLTFWGSSTVTGNVGGAWTGTNPATSTPRDIYAGATGETVNFLGKVYVSATTFHVTGLGTVNFSDDLVGPLVFEDDGVVNFANTKAIVGITAGNGTAKLQSPAADGEGTINFIGSTTQDGELGSFYGDGLNNFASPFGRLKAVNFHSGTTAANVTQALDYSIYAWYTNIGSTNTIGTNPTTTTAIIGRNPNTGDNIHLGTDVTMASDTTTIYTAGAQSRVDYGRADATLSVDFVHTKHADGTLTLGTIAAPVAITQSVFDANLNTNNGTLGFAISAEPYSNSTVPGTYNGVVAADAALSSSINGEGYYLENNNRGSYLNMSGNETIQVAFLGSMKDNVSYTLVDVTNNEDSFGTGPLPYTLLDNSFTIDTTLDRSNNDGDLRITTHRDEYTYLDKSGTKLLGLRSYDMAHRLGTLAADGTGYSAGLQVVFNKLDLDQWGYGNNATNLARQLYLLTPSGDGAAVKAGTGLTAQAVGAVLDGSGSLSTRATPQRSYWVRAYGSHDNQSGSGEYAGHNINGGGATVGTDYQIGDSVVGLAVGYGKAKASSSGLREGDKADVDSTIAGLFFRKPIGEYFLNAMIDAAKHRTKTERQTAVGARANGDYSGTEFGGAIQLGRKFALSDTNESLTPILAVNYSRYKQAAYAETGAGDIGLNYTEQKYTQTDATLSLRYAVEKILGEGIASSFSASLGYKHLLSAPTYNNTVNFVGDTNTFDVAGWKETHKGSVTAALAYNYNPSKGVTYTIDYSGEVKSGYNAHSLGFRATWEY